MPNQRQSEQQSERVPITVYHFKYLMCSFPPKELFIIPHICWQAPVLLTDAYKSHDTLNI